MIVDEFSYIPQMSCLFDLLKEIHAISKWIISATPDLGGFNNVKFMASLIGINLGEDDLAAKRSEMGKAMELTGKSGFMFPTLGILTRK
jgi:hypothetical protein